MGEFQHTLATRMHHVHHHNAFQHTATTRIRRCRLVNGSGLSAQYPHLPAIYPTAVHMARAVGARVPMVTKARTGFKHPDTTTYVIVTNSSGTCDTQNTISPLLHM